MLILGILAIAVLAIYLSARYRRICNQDTNVEDFLEAMDGLYKRTPPPNVDWDFPSKWHPPTGRTKA